MTRGDIHEAIENENVFVALRGSTAVGVLMYRMLDTAIELREFVIAPAVRGEGIGTKFLTFMLSTIPQNLRIELVTHPENPAARLYQRFGFEKEGYIANHYGDGEPRIKMIRSPSG